MTNSNTAKKEKIDGILAKYTAKMSILKQKRDVRVSEFLAGLKEKRINEIRQSIK